MNRKLKKIIRETYNEIPEHKFSFIEQLKSNPAWKKLHPFANFSVISPSVLIFSTVAVAGASTALIAHNSKRTEPEPPVIPDIPPIVTATSTAFRTELTSATSTIISEVQSSTSATSSISFATSAVTSSTVSAVTSSTSANTTVYFPPTQPVTEPPTVPETTTSCYNVHLLRHDYTITELADSDGTLLYGYPDTDIARQLFSGFGDDYISSSIGFNQPPVIEGEITSVEYTSRDGLPVTVWNVLVSEVFDFREVINIGDTVQIATYGGYMDVSEYISLNPDTTLFADWTDEQINSTIIYEDGGNEVQAQTGESYLFVLSPDKEDFGGNSMYTMLAYNDIFRFYRKGDEYFCCNSAHNSSITYESLREITDDRYYFTDGERTLMIKDNSELMMGVQDYYSVDKDGRITYLDTTGTDDGFFPFRNEKDYTIKWTDTGVEITYRFDSYKDIFKTITLNYPK